MSTSRINIIFCGYSKMNTKTSAEYNNKTLIVSLDTCCDRCKERLAEVFQVNGDYYLECWQGLTYQDV
jgi:hypothetical protein